MLNAGIDIGGTFIKLALVETSGEEPVIITRRSFPFGKVGCEVLCERINNGICEMFEETGRSSSDLGHIGLTVPGNIDQTRSILLNAVNLGYYNVPIKTELQSYFPETEIRMINDAKAAALAELKVGALRGCTTAILLTIGTGLGAGLILDGKVFNGGNNRGCEMGHITFDISGDPCSCGIPGCLERYTAATWIARQGKARLGEAFADAKAVKDAAETGNAEATSIIDEYIDHLAYGIAGLCNTFDPERIALGGGFSASGDILYVPLRKLVAERNIFNADYEIVPAKFLNDAGVIGAALL